MLLRIIEGARLTWLNLWPGRDTRLRNGCDIKTCLCPHLIKEDPSRASMTILGITWAEKKAYVPLTVQQPARDTCSCRTINLCAKRCTFLCLCVPESNCESAPSQRKWPSIMIRSPIMSYAEADVGNRRAHLGLY